MADHRHDDESERPGDGNRRQDSWPWLEKALPLLAFAMEGEDSTTRLVMLLVLVLVIQGMAAPASDK